MREKRNPCATNTGAISCCHEKDAKLSQQTETINVYPRGVKTVGESTRVGLPPGAGGRRGKIKGWSPSSRRRFRDYMITHEPDAEIYAVTLTVPGDIVTPEQWKVLFVAYTTTLTRSGVGAIWRLELQKRGQPHLHMIATAPEGLKIIGEEKEDRIACVSLWFHRQWFEHLDKYLPPCEGRIKTGFDTNTGRDSSDLAVSPVPRSALMGADRHAVCFEPDEGDILWWRYLCDHTSKSKQEQICGWEGFRHWGKTTKRRFLEIEPEKWKVSRAVFVKVYRWLRQASRRRIRDPRCVFGSRMAASPRRHSSGSAVWFGVTADQIERMTLYAMSLCGC